MYWLYLIDSSSFPPPITEMRHPCVMESITTDYIPNDLLLSGSKDSMVLLTGTSDSRYLVTMSNHSLMSRVL